jgi:hypothetical protein
MNELSVIVPCVSSTESIPAFLDELAGYLMANPSDVDCIIAANERICDVKTIAKHIQEKYPWMQCTMTLRSGSTRNFGALARFGLAHSTSRYAVLVSPYGEDDLSIITEMLKTVRAGAQVAQATRYETLEDRMTVSARFRLYQSIYRSLTHTLLGASITDSTYGFKMFDRSFMQALGLTQNGFSISPEITLKTVLAGGQVAYVPSKVKRANAQKDFSLTREGFGYLMVLTRGALHRLGFLWF